MIKLLCWQRFSVPWSSNQGLSIAGWCLDRAQEEWTTQWRAWRMFNEAIVRRPGQVSEAGAQQVCLTKSCIYSTTYSASTVAQCNATLASVVAKPHCSTTPLKKPRQLTRDRCDRAVGRYHCYTRKICSFMCSATQCNATGFPAKVCNYVCKTTTQRRQPDLHSQISPVLVLNWSLMQAHAQPACKQSWPG